VDKYYYYYSSIVTSLLTITATNDAICSLIISHELLGTEGTLVTILTLECSQKIKIKINKIAQQI
jgi:hypothetical protein